MKLTTPTNSISNLALPRHRARIAPQSITFTQLAKDCGVAETSLRRRLTNMGVSIPSTGFSRKQAINIRDLVHASVCLNGWILIHDFSACESQKSEALKMAKHFRQRVENLSARITK